MLRAITAFRQKTDQKRWANPRNIHSSWEPRSKIAAALVPNNSRVIEFGAGNRVLERYLDPSCTYVASDLVDRGPGTIICDLNQRPLPDLGKDVYDVAVLLGVVEYLRDVPAVLDWLAELVPVCVLGFKPAKSNGHSPRAMLETVLRRKAGWINNYREEDVRSFYRERGFELLRDENWENQRLFVFSRHPSLG
jgi:Methyltransferase domain